MNRVPVHSSIVLDPVADATTVIPDRGFREMVVAEITDMLARPGTVNALETIASLERMGVLSAAEAAEAERLVATIESKPSPDSDRP